MAGSDRWILYLILALVFINSANNGYDGSMFGSVLTFKEFKSYFGTNGDDSITSNLASIINVGNIVGGFIAGPVIDFRGRRVALAFGCVLVIVASIIQGTTTGASQLTGGRFLVGVGVTICVSAAPIFVAELSQPAVRGTLVGLYNCFWYIGSFASRVTVVALANYSGDAKWRIPLFLQMTPCAIVLLTVWLLPESPRYLMFVGKEKEATDIIARFQADGNTEDPLVTAQIAEMKEEIEREKMYRPDTVIGSLKGALSLFTKRSSLHRLVLAWMIAWFPGVNIISYYFSLIYEGAGITDAATKLWIQLGVDIASFFAAVAGSLFLVERFGRRPMAFLGVTFTVLGMLIIGIAVMSLQNSKDEKGTAHNSTASVFAVLAVYLIQIGFSMNWTPLQALYPTEIWSFALRAKAVGVTNIFWGTSGFLFNYVNPLGIGNLSYNYYWVQAGWNAFWYVIVYFLMVETKGRTLEELDEIFASANPVKESLKPFTTINEKAGEVAVASSSEGADIAVKKA
ncbi:general substrate transporter [Zopfochytrium polystomum]|nr:general substrate transporter [Zopfochytrium polystomum]